MFALLRSRLAGRGRLKISICALFGAVAALSCVTFSKSCGVDLDPAVAIEPAQDGPFLVRPGVP